jgi:hypothetical protein
MALRWIAAALHLLALGFGPSAVWARGRALGSSLDREGLRRVFYADNWWGIAALIWIVTGLLRLFGELEKGTAYYFANRLFWIKMALLATDGPDQLRGSRPRDPHGPRRHRHGPRLWRLIELNRNIPSYFLPLTSYRLPLTADAPPAIAPPPPA